MPITALDVIQRVQQTVQDTEAARWTLPVLLLWLNDATREMVNLKPDLGTQRITFDLVAGVAQPIPDAAERIIRFETAQAPGQSAVELQLASERVIDSLLPGWRGDALPATAVPQYAIYEEHHDEEFLVVPPNDGTGTVTALCLVYPNDIDPPAGGNLADYAIELPLSSAHLSAYVDYVCFRAYSQDSALPAAVQRATTHYQLFAAALGVKSALDTKTNPKAPTSNPAP